MRTVLIIIWTSDLLEYRFILYVSSFPKCTEDLFSVFLLVYDSSNLIQLLCFSKGTLGTGIITFSFHIRSLTGTMLINSKRTAADALAAVEELPGQVDLVLLPPDGGDGPVSDEDVDPDWVPPEEGP